jgi:hypothetical protein
MDFVLDDRALSANENSKMGHFLELNLTEALSKLHADCLCFLAPVGIFSFFCAATLRTAQKGTVPAMADISSLLSLLEDKHRQAKQQCDDEKARNIDWLEETVANTKKQLLHRL